MNTEINVTSISYNTNRYCTVINLHPNINTVVYAVSDSNINTVISALSDPNI